jgi:hypothetical protein
MHRLDLLIRLRSCEVALKVALHSFLFLLLAQEGFHSTTEKLTASFSPISALLVCGFKELWRQANGDLDGFTHSTSPSEITPKYEKSMNDQDAIRKGSAALPKTNFTPQRRTVRQ